MKKILALLFSTLFLLNVCCGCSDGEKESENSSKQIMLTEENYKDYLNVEVSTYKEKNGSIVYGLATADVIADLTVKGLSSNFIYHNVVITVEANVVLIQGSRTENKQITLIADCDVAGNGRDSQIAKKYTNWFLNQNESSYSIVSITGSVERA